MNRWKWGVLAIVCLIAAMTLLTFWNQCLVNLLVAQGSTRWVRVAVTRGTNVSENCKGAYPIIIAVQSRRLSMVEYLLSEKVNVNVRDQDSMTPLMWAAEEGEAEISKQLIAAGADVNPIDHIGSTPLWYSVRTGSYQTAKLLINAGANPNHIGTDGETPLMLAAASGNVRILELLLASGAERRSRDNKGRTALDYIPQPRDATLTHLLDPISSHR